MTAIAMLMVPFISSLNLVVHLDLCRGTLAIKRGKLDLNGAFGLHPPTPLEDERGPQDLRHQCKHIFTCPVRLKDLKLQHLRCRLTEIGSPDLQDNILDLLKEAYSGL